MKTNNKVFSAAVLALFVLITAALIIGKAPKKTETPGKEETDVTVETKEDIYSREEKDPTITVDDVLGQIVKVTDGSVRGVSDASALPTKKAGLSGAGNLAASGYYTTDLPYEAGSFIIAKMKAGFELPDKYSLREYNVKKLTYAQSKDYAPFEAVYTEVAEDRPALSMYMGYIFADNGETIDIYSNTGRYLTSFDDTEFIPAYTRDASGNPLFYKMTTVQSGLTDGIDISLDKTKKPTRVRDPHEKEKTVQVEGQLVGLEKKNIKDLTEDEVKAKLKELLAVGNPQYEEKKAFYALSYDGSYFAASDYDESVDGRGVNFDYPKYYGLSDNGLKLYAEKYNKIKKAADGKITLEHKIDWNYTYYGTKIGEEVYEDAYNFSEGLACVFREPYYRDGGLFFIDSAGHRAFTTLNKYNNITVDKYVIDNFMPPISNGPESIGYYYYDHGLVRVRLETIDYFNYNTNNNILVNSSREVLIDKAGKIFPVPVGYEIKSYSNGIICLEKNGKYGYMNYMGEWIAEPVYKYASPFSEGLGVLETEDGKCGVIDTAGNIVLPFSYEHVSTCSDGVFVAYSEKSGWEILRKMKAYE